ncbi:MAG: beta-glucosidase family protein [Mycobacteriales bacterium]
MSQLSIATLAGLTGGQDNWRTTAVAAADIPALKFTDGPIGARGDLSSATTSTAFPCGSALGATWDPGLAAELGAALAEEARSKGARVLLAPTVNLVRHPLAGRNFECLSEDPELTALLVVPLIRALQAAGVGACIKHFVANDQETDRMSISAQVDEVTLREIYLRPFESAVAAADPWALMAAYNKVNGIYATENTRLLRDILKQEWGWPGVVVSDWWATHDTARAANGGLDLEMPGPPLWLGAALATAAEAGQVEASVVREMASRVLRLLARAGCFEQPEEDTERSEETPDRRALARRIASRATVLLRNDGLLPLPAAFAGNIALIGPAAHPGFEQGGGSAMVFPHRRVSPLVGLRAALPDATVRWARGVALGRFAAPLHPDLLPDTGWTATFWTNPQGTGEPVHVARWPDLRYSFLGKKVPGLVHPGRMHARFATTLTPDASGPWTFQLACAGRVRVTVAGIEVLAHEEDAPLLAIFPEGLVEYSAEVQLTAGEPVEVVAELTVDTRGCVPHLNLGATPPDPRAELAAAALAAADADVAIVVVGTGSEFESEGRDRTELALPGGQDRLVEAVLAAQPNTVVVVAAGAPVDLPWVERTRACLWTWFGGQEGGHALADVITGAAEPAGRLPVTLPRLLPSDVPFPGDGTTVAYSEGTRIGYRRDELVRFPFGHGGSYTTIVSGEPRAEVCPDGAVNVTVALHNCGARAGVEVVQVYSLAPADRPDVPPRQLAGFATVELAAGEQACAQVSLSPRSLAFWDTAGTAWRVPGGQRRLAVARSATDILGEVTVTLAERLLPTPQR